MFSQYIPAEVDMLKLSPLDLMNRIEKKNNMRPGSLAFSGRMQNNDYVRSTIEYLTFHRSVENFLRERHNMSNSDSREEFYESSLTSQKVQRIIARLENTVNRKEYATVCRVYYTFFKKRSEPLGYYGIASWGYASIAGYSNVEEKHEIPVAGDDAVIPSRMKIVADDLGLGIYGAGDDPVLFRKNDFECFNCFRKFVEDVDIFYEKVGHSTV